jgi:hypothetical protein
LEGDLLDREDDVERWDLERLVWHRALTLLLVGLPVLWFVGEIAGLSDYVCGGALDYPVCSARVRELVEDLPLYGGVAGLLVCLVAGGLAVRHRRTPYPWIGLALVFPVVATVVSVAIASA